jgi:trans-2-enoyl-CoA reductase
MHFTRAISTILAARIARAFSFSAETTGLEYENLVKQLPSSQNSINANHPMPSD